MIKCDTDCVVVDINEFIEPFIVEFISVGEKVFEIEAGVGPSDNGNRVFLTIRDRGGLRVIQSLSFPME